MAATTVFIARAELARYEYTAVASNEKEAVDLLARTLRKVARTAGIPREYVTTALAEVPVDRYETGHSYCESGPEPVL